MEGKEEERMGGRRERKGWKGKERGDHLAGFKGPTSTEREGRERRGKGGKGRRGNGRE